MEIVFIISVHLELWEVAANESWKESQLRIRDQYPYHLTKFDVIMRLIQYSGSLIQEHRERKKNRKKKKEKGRERER